MADRFLIAPYDSESGQQNNYRPWLIPDTAFSELSNAYVFRGRVRKRFGSRWMGESQLTSRLRINIGVTPGPLTIPNSAASNMLAVGQIFSIGTDIFTINQLGNVVTLSTNAGIVATINSLVNPNTVTFAGAPAGSAVYWYPSLPVMGLTSQEQLNINFEPVIAYDTRFAYTYTATGWERLAGGADVWTGDNSDFFWSTNWTGTDPADLTYFVTNFDEADPNYMRYFLGGTWTSFRPQITTTDFLNNARILVPFKNRLIAFNTWEGTAIPGQRNYPFRARYSQAGNPIDLVNGWRTDIKGRGGFVDAATTEAIITVEFIKDRLIVFFERSTWEFVYTSNQAFPFVWQQINTELGAESTFSIVPFDKVAVGVGNVGIMAANSGNVERIDQKIPNEVFQIHNIDSGVQRVYGIRDYFAEHVYWTFPAINASADFPYPNRVLVYNYDKGTWAFNDDSFTCFGYFQSATASVLWSSGLVDWTDEQPWGGANQQAQFRQVIAGNQEGYTAIIDQNISTNALLLQITDVTIPVPGSNVIRITSIDHNFREGEYVYLSDITGTGNLNLLNNKIFRIITIINRNAFEITYSDSLNSIIAGVYSGAGVISRNSKITIRTKEYNFYAKNARNAYIPKVDFLVDKTTSGEIQVDFLVSTNTNSMIAQGQTSGSLLGTSIVPTSPYALYPYEAQSTRLWRSCFFNAEGEVVQFVLSFNDDQMTSTTIRQADFQLHAIAIHAQPTSRLQ